MATTSPDNLRTPNPGDPYNLVADLATFANDVQVALNKKTSNLLVGTTAQRVAATSTATDGILWQDTDGIKMVWRKDGAAWVPAVTRWSGTNSQMTGFTQAQAGFEWFNTTDNRMWVRLGGAWRCDRVSGTVTTGTIAVGGFQSVPVTFPTGAFATPPNLAIAPASGRLTVGFGSLTNTGVSISVNNWSTGPAPGAEIQWTAFRA